MAQYIRLLMVVALLAGTSACSSDSEDGLTEALPEVSSCISPEEDDGTADCVNYAAPDERHSSDSVGVQDAVADAAVADAVN